jgi:hypothetical protein
MAVHNWGSRSSGTGGALRGRRRDVGALPGWSSSQSARSRQPEAVLDDALRAVPDPERQGSRAPDLAGLSDDPRDQAIYAALDRVHRYASEIERTLILRNLADDDTLLRRVGG